MQAFIVTLIDTPSLGRLRIRRDQLICESGTVFHESSYSTSLDSTAVCHIETKSMVVTSTSTVIDNANANFHFSAVFSCPRVLAVINEQGSIQSISAASSPSSQKLVELVDPAKVLKVPKGRFLLPTFVDLHQHAPQYLFCGTGLDLPLLEWLDK